MFSFICQFLTRVISQSVMKLRESVDTTDLKAGSLSRLKMSDTCQWPSKLIETAQDLGLDIDFLKRHYVCELYSAGFDRLAEEVSFLVTLKCWKEIYAGNVDPNHICTSY